MRIREWTGSDASHWTPDLQSHLCPLSSQSVLGPDVCSQLKRSHSTTAAEYPEQVKGISISTGLSYKHTRVTWVIRIESKQITLFVQRKQSSFFPRVKLRNKLESFMLIYSKQSFIWICFELNEPKKAFFFFFEWSHAEIGLRGEHIAPVSSCSGQQTASVVRYISLHPPIHPSGWYAHIVMQTQKTHKRVQQSTSWTQMKCHLQEHILLIHYVLPEVKHTSVFSHINLHTLKRTLSCGHFSWVGLLVLWG